VVKPAVDPTSYQHRIRPNHRLMSKPHYSSSLHNFNPELISDPFGVRFEFTLKRWVCDRVSKILGNVRSNWIADPTSMSMCLVPVRFVQQKS